MDSGLWKDFSFFAKLLLAVAFFSFGLMTEQRSLIFLGVIIFSVLTLRSFNLAISAPGYTLFLLIPPFTTALSLIIGFDLRIFETVIAAQILERIDPAAIAQGNMLFFKNTWFIVDPVCEGMKLGIALSILNGLIISERQLGTWRQHALLKLTYLAMNLALWMIANQIRILIIVIGKIPEKTMLHELVGVIVIVCICFLPVYFYSVVAFAPKFYEAQIFRIQMQSHRIIFCAVVFLLMLIPSLTFKKKIPLGAPWPKQLASLPYDGSAPENSFEVAVYADSSVSVIVKRYLSPFTSAHHPRLCWEGLGYAITQEESISSESGQMHSALIRRNRELKWMLWWYVSPSSNLISDSELGWRINTVFKNQQFILYNLVGKDKKKLLIVARQILRE